MHVVIYHGGVQTGPHEDRKGAWIQAAAVEEHPGLLATVKGEEVGKESNPPEETPPPNP